MKRFLTILPFMMLAGCGPKPAAVATPTTPAAPGAAAAAAAPDLSVFESHPHKAFADESPIAAAPLRTDWKPVDLAAACEAAEKTCDAQLAYLAKIPDDKRTFANTVGALEQITAVYSGAVGRLAFMKEIHPDAKVREAASACEERAGKYGVAISARKDLYLAVKGYQEHAGKTDKLDAQDARLLAFTMRDFKRSGLELKDADRDALTKIRSRLAEVTTKFSTNLDEDKSSITARKDELDGMPDEFIKRLKANADGTLTLTTKYPDYYPIMENAKNAELRRRMQVAFMNRGMPENIALETEAVALRDRAAKLLGYATHADYVTEVNMGKNAKTVTDFEARLTRQLKPRLDAETKKMVALKVADLKGSKDKDAAVLHSWDWRYYQNQIKKRDFSLDDEAVRAYFPADKVMNGMFQVYATVLGIEFKEVPFPAGVKPWSEGVQMYEIHDAASKRLLAIFYTDLYPREGKFGHAASFDISIARETPAGYETPMAALVTNFNPPSNGQVAHLSVDEVTTLFHEFGHVMHMSLTEARYSSLAGSNVARDFVEAPSQMLENWVYEAQVLKMISRDPKDPSKTMPDDLMKKVVAARTYDSGVKYSRQVMLGTFDLWIHTHGEKVDIDKECKRIWDETTGFPQDPNEHFASTFGHPMGGYDAGYYGYLWSLVFAADMYTRFQKEGVLNPQTGHAYRESILAKGRTEDPDALLHQFLGRDPNETAFVRLVGASGS